LGPLWLDVKRLVVIRFQAIFYYMEEEGMLDPLDELHLFVLHLVFLPMINKALDELTSDWNNHPLSSENNFSPEQLWHLGLADYRNSNPDGYEELNNIHWREFGIDYEGPLPDEEDGVVNIPETFFPLTDAQFTHIENELQTGQIGQEIDTYANILGYIQRFV